MAAAEAAVAKALGSSAQSTATAAKAKATIATRAAAVAQNVATGANALANSAIGKVLLLAANVLALAGSIAGLFALYATLKVVFPRLDAHDRQLAQHDSELSKQMSLIVGQEFKIRSVKKTADVALQMAERAVLLSEFNDLQIRKVKAQVETVNGKATKAIKEAENAIAKANVANNRANESFAKSVTAIGVAQVAEGKAIQATNRANESFRKSEDAIGQAGKAIGVANVANVFATLAEAEAQKAVEAASVAIKEIATLKPRVDSVEKEAVEAKSIGRLAYKIAVEVKPIAVDALAQVSQVRPISEQALTNAFNALNRVNTVEPVANNAFTATQLQSKQLQGTKLEVTGLGNTAKVQDKKIVELGDRINNFKPPTTTPTTPNVDKEALEKLTQVIVSVGALKIAMDNMPKNIANSPAFQGAVVNATTTANCRTAQPGGCTTRMVDNVVNNAANNAANKANNDLLSKLGNLFNTGANAEQLRRLGEIQKTVSTVDTKLGPLMKGADGISGFLGRLSNSLGIDRALNLIGIASNLHNAMMLSANLKITLLEMLSSVGNATGLLQTSENENVDLNAVFNRGIETFLISILGVESYAGLKVGLRKYNAIYQAAANSLNAVSSMFNSLGNVVEQGAEYTGRIGNALKGAGMVAENAYQWMAEKFDAKSSRFIKFQSTVGDITQVLETINETAESVVEGQQAATEFQKANTEFIKAVEDAKKTPGIENKAIKEEAAKAKENASKDPTGELEEGLLSFLTN